MCEIMEKQKKIKKKEKGILYLVGPQGKARWHLRALGSPVAVLLAHRSRWLPRCRLGPWAGDATAP
jgi:hypothetical protein